LRLPSDLKRALEKSAKSSHRSMNAELVLRLEKTLEDMYPLEHAPRVVKAGGAGHGVSEPAAGHSGTEMEKRLLEAFRTMSPAARQGLLTLLEGTRAKNAT